jgi:hypothetical protein
MPADERQALRQHLSACPNCARQSNGQLRVRGAVRSLPRLNPPADLTLRLRVAASKARAEVRGPGRWSRWRDRFELALSHLMRPLALPAVGGLCSAIFLFSALVPTFNPTFVVSATSPWDVPTMLTTQPMVKYMAPIAFGGDAMVDVNVDGQGRIVSYVIVGDASGQNSDQVRRSIENNLLFTEFWPATAFGVPIAGSIRISYRSPAGIDVKG